VDSEEKETLALDLAEQKKEALRLRLDYEILPPTASPSLIREEMLKIRQRVDFLEGILQNVGTLRRKYQRQYATVKTLAEIAFNDALLKANFGQYTSTIEKGAIATQDSFALQREASEAEEVFIMVDGVYRAIEIAHRGLNDYRLDLHRCLGSTPFDSNLER
jgi:hypothetical protein